MLCPQDIVSKVQISIIFTTGIASYSCMGESIFKWETRDLQNKWDKERKTVKYIKKELRA